ncbi:zinc dependent phospholipase C family protein [Dyadobacter tibetensis]|uniref:zinc dependent phospholipase C family protein n=1 Tax=Dyadobacter tibetensis TaxID=1211851 RepID=UPI000470EBC2|nr:zinc dependent phospholipase C family protein [Dyadobacter tibetensis]
MKIDKKWLLLLFIPLLGSMSQGNWGFWAHRRINRLAVFRLPAEMQVFYKQNMDFIVEEAVGPDKRRYSVVGEAERHYIDIDSYHVPDGEVIPKEWKRAVERFGEDSLRKHGIAPWNIERVCFQLTEAFSKGQKSRILRLSADLGHYIADIHVPLHTTRNYNGQFTDQVGIHGLWESRLPELFADEYDLWIGSIVYRPFISEAIWSAVYASHIACDSVFDFERLASKRIAADRKYSYESRNNILVRTYSESFAREYERLLNGQVERRMRAAIGLIGDIWYTCWVNAGQPNLTNLEHATPLVEGIEKKSADTSQTGNGRPLPVRPEPDD